MQTPESVPKLENAAEPEKRARPFFVTLLALGVLTLTVLNLTRLVQVIVQWDFLQQNYATLVLVYLAISGLVWAASGALLVYGLWRGNFWAPGLARVAAVLYLVYFWLDRLLMRFYASPLANWPFLMLVTLAAAGVVFWILSRKRVKVFFGETYDH
ncbi:MAG TPA: hypothetical protein VLS48_00190 [Anaerolineales bacterium]|nr:hypothetical protein [Anaerolineales bacterium]